MLVLCMNGLMNTRIIGLQGDLHALIKCQHWSAVGSITTDAENKGREIVTIG